MREGGGIQEKFDFRIGAARADYDEESIRAGEIDMRRFGLFLGIGLAAGCCSAELAPLPQQPAAQLPVVPRGTIEPDVSAAAIEPVVLPPVRPKQYRQLTAEDCRRLAIQNAPLANELDSHPDNQPARLHPFKKPPEQAHLAKLVRGYAADEIRNRAAADALEAYYKLATAEGQFDHVVAAHGILRKELTSAEKAINVGAADRANADRMRRQLLELESQLAKLEAGIAGLNASLIGRLGLDPKDPTPIWPADTLRIGPDVSDVELAVQTALRCRPDLNLLRTLSCGDDRGGKLSNAVLSGLNPLLGTSDPTALNPLLSPLITFLMLAKREPTKAEARLQQQIQSTLATRERQAEAEVRAAAAMVRGNRLSAAAKVAEVRNLTTKVAEAEKRVAAGIAGAEAELATTRLDLQKARGELVQAVADLHISDVKLRQATGMLVRE